MDCGVNELNYANRSMVFWFQNIQIFWRSGKIFKLEPYNFSPEQFHKNDSEPFHTRPKA